MDPDPERMNKHDRITYINHLHTCVLQEYKNTCAQEYKHEMDGFDYLIAPEIYGA